MFTYIVQNFGDAQLENVVVTDDNATPNDSQDDFQPRPVLQDSRNVGDLDRDNRLDIGEQWLYTFIIETGNTSSEDQGDSHPLGQFSNIAAATGTPVDEDGNVVGAAVADSDPAHYFIYAGDLCRLVVTRLVPTASGFVAHFNRPLDRDALNLYDVEAGTMGETDVTVVGNTVGAIRGSLVVDDESVTFVATGGPLPPDDYTVALRSAENGFKTLETGELLDGNGDGTPGDDFVGTLTVAPASVVVGLPDFARGPGQPVDVPATQTGLPLTLADGRGNGGGIESVQLVIAYDAALLNITAAALGPDAPADAVIAADVSAPGYVTVSFSSLTTPLAGGVSHFVTLTADVPATATYGNSGRLTVTDLRVVDATGAAVVAMGDEALQLVAYLGDATGNGSYSGLDAQRVARLAVTPDGGLASYPTADPVLVADVTGNGSISGLDAQRIARKVVGLPSPIPPLPQPLRLDRPPAVSAESNPLTESQLNTVVEAAVARFESVRDGAAAALKDVSFEVVDLPGDLLGLAVGQTIRIDVDAAGYGWFVDTTPWDDVEFARPDEKCELTALPATPAAGRADLLTAVLHELGHVFGYDHEDVGVMDDALPLGARRVWNNALFPDNDPDSDAWLNAPGLTPAAVDDFFATT
jgi:hypothetical protein